MMLFDQLWHVLTGTDHRQQPDSDPTAELKARLERAKVELQARGLVRLAPEEDE